MDQKISLIMPVLNERVNIEKQLQFFEKHPDKASIELIIVDGGSTDGTPEFVDTFGGATLFRSPVAARPHQMNLGAAHASNDLLFFVHADVTLPASFYRDVILASQKYEIGGYRYQFDTSHLLLQVNAFFTRFPMIWCRGGDQTLFIKSALFDQLGGFDEYFTVMEDFDIIRRAKAITKYYIIPKNVTVSARKYHNNGYWKVQMVNLRAFKMFRNGISPDNIRSYYKEALGLKNY